MQTRILTGLTLSACALGMPYQASAANTADAQMVLTFTLDQVLLNGAPATFETSSEVGDVVFEDFGPNGNVITGGGANPPGSIGGGSGSVTYSLNGLDPFVDDYDMDSFGIGDSVIITMDVSATATTPGSVFFGQVADESIFFFSHFGGPTDQFTFQFSWDAQINGTLDNTALPGGAQVFAEGTNVNAAVESPETGPEYNFDLFTEEYFQLFENNPPSTLATPSLSDSGSFDVVFAPGDNQLAITFLSGITVNASVDIPEPSSLALLGLGGLCLARRRR